MTPVSDHELRRASADCWLCQCGFAVFGAANDRVARQRHSQHVDEIRKHRATIKEAQKNGQQTTADFDAGQEHDTHWGSPFRQGVLNNR